MSCFCQFAWRYHYCTTLHAWSWSLFSGWQWLICLTYSLKLRQFNQTLFAQDSWEDLFLLFFLFVHQQVLFIVFCYLKVWINDQLLVSYDVLIIIQNTFPVHALILYLRWLKTIFLTALRRWQLLLNRTWWWVASQNFRGRWARQYPLIWVMGCWSCCFGNRYCWIWRAKRDKSRTEGSWWCVFIPLMLTRLAYLAHSALRAFHWLVLRSGSLWADCGRLDFSALRPELTCRCSGL